MSTTTEHAEFTEALSVMIDTIILRANGKPRVNLTRASVPNFYADVRNGRAPRNLPLTGSHEMYRMADDLDRDAAELVVVFDVAGKINGVEFEKVTIWINGGRVTLPTLFHGSDAARSLLYSIGREVADRTSPDTALMRIAWVDHLERLDVKLAERADFVAAVRTSLHEQLSAALAARGSVSASH